MEEIWKPVLSYPIEASSFGRIRRLPFKKPMPYGGERTYAGKATYGCKVKTSGLFPYRMIYRCESLKKTFKVHRLVCEAFHGLPPFEDSVVMHIDDNPLNNRPENLKWASQKENLNSKQFINYRKSQVGINSTYQKWRRTQHG